MAEKHELVSYLTNLVSIMNSKVANGLTPGNTLTREYTACYSRLTEILRDEHSSQDKEETENEH